MLPRPFSSSSESLNSSFFSMLLSFKSGDDIYYHFDVDSDIKVRNELDENEPNIVGLPKMITFEEIEEEKTKYNYLKNWYFKLYKDFNTGTNFTLQDLIVEKNIN